MKTLIIDNGSSYINKLKRLLQAKVVKWNQLYKVNFNGYGLIVLSGGHKLPVMWHGPEFANEIRIIKKIRKPIIGICLGSELIAHAYGAKLFKLNRREHRTIKIIQNKQIFRVFESHRWAIKQLPKNFIALARSKDGIEIFRHKSRPIFGIQFHPEVLLTKTDGRKLLTNILSGLGRK